MSHLLLDIYTHTQYSLDELEELVTNICKVHDFHVLHHFSHQFTPQGETLVLVLQESHFSIHTYPEKNMVAVDLYTCKRKDWKRLESVRSLLLKIFHGTAKLNLIIERP